VPILNNDTNTAPNFSQNILEKEILENYDTPLVNNISSSSFYSTSINANNNSQHNYNSNNS
jgi:hypothetical protein